MKVLVTGSSGLVGHAVLSTCPEWAEIITLKSSDVDLRNKSDVDAFFKEKEPDLVIHLAARVGGVFANSTQLYDFFYDNILINTNVIEACRLRKIKAAALLSTCIYPDINWTGIVNDSLLRREFLKPKDLHSGEPHPSNYGYAFAKRMMEVQIRASNQQYGTKHICLIPNNIFGPNDNFHIDHSHVIPGLIRKIYESKQNNTQPVLWGDGQSLRQFTLSYDIARCIWWGLEHYSGPPINIGSPHEVSIKYVATIICELLDFPFEKIIWDISKPSGQFRKPMETNNIVPINFTPLQEGIEQTVQWFVNNYPKVRM